MKDRDLLTFMNQYQIDIMGLTEPNVHWGKVQHKDHFLERTRGWFEKQYVSLAYNTNRGKQRSKRSQPGGTITMARDAIAHRWIGNGRDPSRLGRWSSMRFRGKHNSATRVITAYRPVKSHGPSTVYTQQLEFLRKDPIQAFWEDLADEIRQWQSEGDEIILMGDWNENVQADGQLQSWLESLQLVNCLNNLYGKNSPATYNAGTQTIDAIFVSSRLQIIQGGYLGFGELPGDHRGLWIDVTLKSLIGYRPPPILRSEARRLKGDDPEVVSKYNTILDAILTEKGLYERLFLLMEEVGNNDFTKAQEEEFEQIDKESSEAMLYAEKHCRKLKMGGVKWSPTLQKARDTIYLWTLVKRRLKGRKVGARTIIRTKKKLGIIRTQVGLEEATMHLDEAYRVYKVAKAKAESLSMAYREKLAQRRAKERNMKAATELRNLNARERQRVTSRRVQQAAGKNQGQGTSKIEIVGEDGQIKEITEKDEMVDHIIPENENKFHQCASRCPLLSETMINDLGLMGDGPQIDNILDGTYECPVGASWATRRWLHHMKVDSHVQRNEIIATLADFRQGWKQVNEKTSSGKHHFGHFKSGCLHRRIGWFLYVRSVLPYNRGYSPTRWQQGTDVMLLKKQELFLLTKLRTIVLYEADYNHENKRLGRDTIRMALQQGRIAEEQFCRPGRSAQSNALCKRLVFDYARTKKKPFAFGSSDLASCYDRIVHNAASIALQRIGISRRKIQSMFGTVQNLVHRVRTLFGDSSKKYGGKYSRGKFRCPPQGTGQGNGAAPSIWTVLSSTIFEILHEEGHSTSFIFAISLGLFKVCGFSYVDDCDLVKTGTCSLDVAEEFQDLLTMWDELMEITGAALAPEKCWWYLVGFEWVNGKWRMTDPIDDFELRARDKSGTMVSLKRLQRNESREMVGVYLAPDGNEKDQIEVLKKKSKRWAQQIKDSNLDFHCVWTALTTSAIKTIEYPLPATTISSKQMKEIMWPLLSAALPRSGYVRTFPRAVLYGPTAMQGLGVKDPFVYQFTRHVRDIVQNVWKGDVVGKFLRAEIEAITLEAGVPGSIFEYDGDITWFNTTNSWVIETLRFCRSNHITFDDRCSHLHLKRENDCLLMDIFRKRGYSNAELKQLNRCRLYLGVSNLSDITNGRGTHLMEQVGTGHHLPQSNCYDWPVQSRPPRKELNFWLLSIRRCFAPELDRLTRPLGTWNISSLAYKTEWEWFISDIEDLYQRRGRTWRLMHRHERTRVTRQQATIYSSLQSAAITLPSPPDFPIFRTTVKHMHGNLLQHQGSSPNSPTDEDKKFPHTEQGLHRCLKLQSDSTWTCQFLKIVAPVDRIAAALFSGNCVSISDGSLFPRIKMGGASWCIATKEGVILIQGGGLIPGPPSIQSPYRSECGGLHGIVICLKAFEICFEHEQPYQIVVGCDGQTALHKSIREPREIVSTSQKHIDIISRTQDVLATLAATVQPHHVRGHQDTKSNRPLTIEEGLNVKMDFIAKEIVLRQRARDILCPIQLPCAKIGISIITVKDVHISSDLDNTIHDEVSTNRLLDYWINDRCRLGLNHEILIDWDVMKATMIGFNRRMKRFVPKWVTSQISVGNTMRKREARYNNCCPRCYHFTEDTTHVLRCHHREAKIKWKSMITKLSQWMEGKDTHPHLQSGITATLHSWYMYGGAASIPDFGQDEDKVGRAFLTQSQLGWKSFMEGIFSLEWSRIQQKWYEDIESRKTGHRWAVGLSRELWQIIYGMWEHRNTMLHAKENSARMNGIQAVKASCLQELELGMSDDLDDVYRVYLDTSVEDLMKYEPLELRNWLAVVRKAREISGHCYSDDLSTDKALRKWVGLDD